MCTGTAGKVSLCLINTLLLVLTIVIIAASAATLFIFIYTDYVEGRVSASPHRAMITATIIVFALMVFVCIAGCVSACIGIKPVLLAYCVLLFLITVAQGTSIIVLGKNRASMEMEFHDSLLRWVQSNYTIYTTKIENGSTVQEMTNTSLRETWDNFQVEIKCCGADGPKDWKDSRFFNESARTTPVPQSCCKDKKEMPECFKEARNAFDDKPLPEETNLHTKGCFTLLKEAFGMVSFIIGLGIFIIVLEVIAMVLAAFIGSKKPVEPEQAAMSMEP